MSKKLNKRLSESSGLDNPSSSCKKQAVDLSIPTNQSIGIGPVSTLEEMDDRVIRFQYSKIKEKLKFRIKQEEDLKQRIEQLEKRQIQDDRILNVINRYWNQLNENIRVLLQRFDAETSDESETKNESEATTSFLALLSTWDKEELDEKLANRVQVSTRAVAKIIQAFDRLQQRNEKICKIFKGELGDKPVLDNVLKTANSELEKENKNLQGLHTTLHSKYHTMSLKMKEMAEKLTAAETKRDELQNQVHDLNWEVSKLVANQSKLQNYIQDAKEKIKKLKEVRYEEQKANLNDIQTQQIAAGNLSSKNEILGLKKENEGLKDVANNRLLELQDLMLAQKDTIKELEKLKMELRLLPESIIVDTTEYKNLQSKFSIVFNNNNELQRELNEKKDSLRSIRNDQLLHIEQLEAKEFKTQKKMREEMMHLEDIIGQIRMIHNKLRIEYEQNLAENEQMDPLNREMRHLISSLQKHNDQLKEDLKRYKRKYKEANLDLNKIKKINENLGKIKNEKVGNVSNAGNKNKKDESTSTSSLEEETNIEKSSNLSSSKFSDPAIIIKELKTQLKKAINDQKEVKLLLDMYRGGSKEQRDKAQLMASEKKLKLDLEELKGLVKKYQDNEKEGRKIFVDEETLNLKKFKSFEEKISSLQTQIMSLKQEEETMTSEMEVLGQAYEDMEEQNLRLIQQLKEKDDANFKLISDRIKSTQLQKLTANERDLLRENVDTLSKQIEAKNEVVSKLEEKEDLLLNSITALESESVLRQQVLEIHKRKAFEHAQAAADLNLHLEKYHSQIMEVQSSVADKTSALEAEAFKTRRLQEEIEKQKRKIERLKLIEQAGNQDIVLQEEVREYKELLTCPSCKVKRKDTVLTKCFHVFCFDCLRTRYETRQRKCPKCNAAFGANDYNRIFLS